MYFNKFAGMARRMAFVLLAVLCVSPLINQAQAQSENTLKTNPLNHVDTSSPRATIRSFQTNSDALVRHWREGGSREILYLLTRAAGETMDLSATIYGRSWNGQIRRILMLKEILARIDIPDPGDIPGSEEVVENKNSDWTIPGTRLTISRLTEGPRKGEYVFNSNTVEKLDISYRRVKALPYKPGQSGIYEAFLQSSRGSQSALEKARALLQGLDTSSPRTTLEGFLETVNDAYRLISAADKALAAVPPKMTLVHAREVESHANELLRRAVSALDLRQVPIAHRQDDGVEAVLKLKEIFDRMDLPPIDYVPDSSLAESLEIGSEAQFRWRLPGTEIEIVKIIDGDRLGDYLFSASTVARIDEFYEKLKDLPYRSEDAGISTAEYRSPESSPGFFASYTSKPGDLLPQTSVLGRFVDALPDSLKTSYGSQTGWQWIALVLTALITLTASISIFRVVSTIARRFPAPLADWAIIVGPIACAGLVRIAIYFIDESVNLTGSVLASTRFVGELSILVLLAWAAWECARAIAETYAAIPGTAVKGVDGSLVRIVANLIGFVLAVWIIVSGLRALGVDAVPLLAGLGVGGFAAALAVRPTLENLIGGLILYIDRPVAVGDFCTFGESTGTVEKIGIRSTQIRGLDRTLISIPNARFVDMEIVNWARCDRMLIQSVIGLRNETLPDQLRAVLVAMREMFHAHPKIDSDTVRVRFSGYGSSSLEITIRVYALTREWNEFHSIREDIFLRINDIVREAGTNFAFPSQTLYMGRDPGIEEERQQAAIQKVKAWRKSGNLPFPNLKRARVAEIDNTLDYPPQGSPETALPQPPDAKIPEPLSTEDDEEAAKKD